MRVLLAMALAASLCCWGKDLPTFNDVTKSSGITFKHSIGDVKLDNIVEGTGAGACVFDFNNDGLMDIYFVTGKWDPSLSDNRSRNLQGKLINALYQNLGGGKFKDVTQAAGVDGKNIYSTGCSAADYDNDGDVDLYLLNHGRNILYQNQGDGTFKDVSRAAGLDDQRWSVSAVWLDYNHDGHLDVYVANYLEYDAGKFRDFYAASGYPGPLSYKGQADALYRNNKDGSFTEVTQALGMLREQHRAMSVSAADFNNDGFLDIYVANDAMENLYFESDAKGGFREKGLALGLAFSEHGQGVSSMGPSIGDVNRDGKMDIFIPDLRYNTLLIQGDHGFEDKTSSAKLASLLGQYSGWGPVLFDFDHDGWPDLFVTHGHAHFEYVQEDSLLLNQKDGSFADVSRSAGPYFFEKHVGRGAAYGDFNNDGHMDLVLINLNAPAKLLLHGGSKQSWLMVDAQLKCPKGQRSAIGARVTLKTGALVQIDDVQPVRGYLSQGDPRLHFGLGNADTIEELSIRWPDQKLEVHKNLKANQILKLIYDSPSCGGRSL